MNVKVRALIITTTLAVLFTLAFLLFPQRKYLPADKTTQDGTPVIITDIPVSEVLALALYNNYGTFGILNSPDGVQAMSANEATLSLSQMRAIVYMASHLTGIRLLENYPLPGVTEIINSTARFTLILSDSHSYNFVILQKNSIGDGYILFFEEQKVIYLISDSTAECFLQEP